MFQLLVVNHSSRKGEHNKSAAFYDNSLLNTILHNFLINSTPYAQLSLLLEANIKML
jgi:hypothetical protein